MYKSGTIANSQRTPTKINKNWCYCKIKSFSGASNTRRHLRTFRIITNEMPV